MAFADPDTCPACRGRLDGSPRCPSCGLDLTSHEVAKVWQSLLQADRWVQQAIIVRDAPPATSQPATPPPAMPPPEMPPPNMPPPAYPQRQSAPPRERSWSVGTIVLALGAFGLVAAALIFVSRSWDTIGLTGKALILAFASLACASVGVWVTKRPLRASAEALWSVFAVMIVVDGAGARAEGLAGLDGVSWPWTWVVIGLLVTASSAFILMWARQPVGTELWSMGIGAVCGVAITATAAAGVIEGSVFWSAFGALVVAGVMGLTLRVTESTRVAVGARLVVAVFYVLAAVAAFAELVDHPSFGDLFGRELHALPMMLMLTAALVVAATVRPLRTFMTAIAVLGLFALVAVPVADRWDSDGIVLALSIFATVPAVVAAHGHSEWVRGLRLGTVVPVAGLVSLGAWWLVVLLGEIGLLIDDPWDAAASGRFPATTVNDIAAGVTCGAAVALIIAIGAFARWPEVPGAELPAMALALPLLSIPGIIVATRPSWWIATGLFVLVALLAVLLHGRDRPSWWWPVVALVAVVGGSLVALGAQGASVLAWTAGGGVLLVLVLVRGAVTAWLAAATAPVLLAGAASAAADLAGAERFWVASSGLAVGLALLIGCALVGDRLSEAARALEISAGLVVVTAASAVGSGPRGATVWTLVGVACCVIASVSDRRRWYVVPGVLALITAYVLLVVDQGFTFVEAYTLPIGVAMTAAGVWWMRHRPETGSWLALGAGLCMSLLPSVPQAMAEPTDLRALLLGIGAVAVLGIGAKLDWQAPFVLGCLVAGQVVLSNIGPYANAAPRVLVIAGVSTILVAVGITWEDRVRDGRRAMAFLKAMR